MSTGAGYRALMYVINDNARAARGTAYLYGQ